MSRLGLLGKRNGLAEWDNKVGAGKQKELKRKKFEEENLLRKKKEEEEEEENFRRKQENDVSIVKKQKRIEVAKKDYSTAMANLKQSFAHALECFEELELERSISRDDETENLGKEFETVFSQIKEKLEDKDLTKSMLVVNPSSVLWRESMFLDEERMEQKRKEDMKKELESFKDEIVGLIKKKIDGIK